MPVPWEEEPDAGKKPWEEEPTQPDPPDPGYLAAAGRFARGTATGVESTIDRIGRHLPFAAADPKLVESTLAKRPPPKDPAESAGVFFGEIAPAFAVPGFEGPAGATMLEGGLGALARGALQGGIGGAMMPEGSTGKNIATGALTGMATGGLGAAFNALPWRVKNAINMAAADYASTAIRTLGVPRIPGDPIFWQLYKARLVDLASRWAARFTPAAGATAAGVRNAVTQDQSP